MSLAKIPFAILFALGVQVAFTPPNPAAPTEHQIIREGLIGMHLATGSIGYASWIHLAIELAIILAAAVPKSKVAESVLAFLLPSRDPNRIYVSPMGIFATTLMVTGAIIRFQCFREMGKHFTFQVALLKDHKLITTGPYSYVRHPSYTGGYLCLAGVVIWCTAQGSWLRESGVYKNPLAWLVMAPVIVNWILLVSTISMRTSKEDEILKKAFGKDWDEWARKVPNRLLPGIY